MLSKNLQRDQASEYPPPPRWRLRRSLAHLQLRTVLTRDPGCRHTDTKDPLVYYVSYDFFPLFLGEAVWPGPRAAMLVGDILGRQMAERGNEVLAGSAK